MNCRPAEGVKFKLEHFEKSSVRTSNFENFEEKTESIPSYRIYPRFPGKIRFFSVWLADIADSKLSSLNFMLGSRRVTVELHCMTNKMEWKDASRSFFFRKIACQLEDNLTNRFPPRFLRIS